ncbi:MAG: hypothetical protein AAF764_00235 [Pseudomonadota bacterium]
MSSSHRFNLSALASPTSDPHYREDEMKAIRRLTSVIVLLSFLLVAASLSGYTGIANVTQTALVWVTKAFPYLFVAALVLTFLRRILLGRA